MRWLAVLMLCSGCGLLIGLDEYRSSGEGIAASSQGGEAQTAVGGAGQGAGDPRSTASQGGSATSAGGGSSSKELGESCGVASECASGFCVDSVCCDSSCETACAKCNGAGACVPEDATATCGAYYCNGSDVTCPTSCTAAIECASTYWCNVGVTDTCVPDNSGAYCNAPTDCTYGDCNGGVCCNSTSTPCNGVCRSCNGAYTGFGNGFCANIEAGDPEGDCGASCMGCVCQFGACVSPA